ncbi:hypothetical protein GCM10011499_30790 [Pelagibacterium lentulum]|uniref:Uncharacterized protein n=1 Tax=Pelagibacterium lentulum TaxID=2029865 RepID=A0A916RJ21_9HYPH|nr:hypothetical protein GCM10011499_30790 [Pelagibacterium lentulum]
MSVPSRKRFSISTFMRWAWSMLRPMTTIGKPENKAQAWRAFRISQATYSPVRAKNMRPLPVVGRGRLVTIAAA